MIILPKGGFNFVSFYQFHNGSFNNHLGIKQYSERIYIERIKKEIKTEWTYHYKTSHIKEISTSVLEEYLIKVDKIKKGSSAFYSGQLLFKYLLKARLFHRSPDNIQQLIRYRLLASLATCIANVRAACSDALESIAAVKTSWHNTFGIKSAINCSTDGSTI